MQGAGVVLSEKILGPSDQVLNALPVRLTSRPQLQVLDPVVGPDAVQVVDILSWRQGTAKVVRHHGDVLVNPPTGLSVRVVGPKDLDVPVAVDGSPLGHADRPQRHTPRLLAQMGVTHTPGSVQPIACGEFTQPLHAQPGYSPKGYLSWQ